jgi:bacterioferritin
MKHAKNETSVTNVAILSDIQTLRKHARKNIEEGAVTTGYGANRKEVIRLLN